MQTEWVIEVTAGVDNTVRSHTDWKLRAQRVEKNLWTTVQFPLLSVKLQHTHCTASWLAQLSNEHNTLMYEQ